MPCISKRSDMSYLIDLYYGADDGSDEDTAEQQREWGGDDSPVALRFTDKAAADLKVWLDDITDDRVGPATDLTIQDYFNSLDISNLDYGYDIILEVNSFYTKSGNPEIYLVTRNMVEYGHPEPENFYVPTLTDIEGNKFELKGGGEI